MIYYQLIELSTSLSQIFYAIGIKFHYLSVPPIKQRRTKQTVNLTDSYSQCPSVGWKETLPALITTF